MLKEGNGRVKMFTPIGPNESGAEFAGLRVTPSVYTTVDEIDRFSEAMLTGIKKGIA